MHHQSISKLICFDRIIALCAHARRQLEINFSIEAEGRLSCFCAASRQAWPPRSLTFEPPQRDVPNETCPPTIAAFGSRCCRAGGRVPTGVRAILPDAAGAP